MNVFMLVHYRVRRVTSLGDRPMKLLYHDVKHTDAHERTSMLLMCLGEHVEVRMR